MPALGFIHNIIHHTANLLPLLPKKWANCKSIKDRPRIKLKRRHGKSLNISTCDFPDFIFSCDSSRLHFINKKVRIVKFKLKGNWIHSKITNGLPVQ